MRLGIYRLKDWFLLVPIAVAAVVFGMIGFERCATADCHVGSLGDALVRTLFLIRSGQSFVVGRDPWELVLAQFLMFALLVVAGLLASVKLFVRNLRHDVQLARVQTMRGHVVVCGLGETGLAVVRGLQRAGRQVVAITREDSAEAIAQCDRLGVPVLSGDASRAETLVQAGIARAEALVATTGSDATNLDIAAAAGRRLARRTTPLTVRPEIRAPWLIDAMAAPRTPIFDAGMLVHPLHIEELAARRLLATAGFPRTAGARPRLVLAGLGTLGAALLRHAVLSTFALPGVRAEILCYDHAAEACQAVLAAAPWRQFLDLEVRDAHFGSPDGDPARPTDWDAIAADLAARPPDAVIVALADDDAALEAAFGLRDALDRQKRFATPVHVRTRRQRGLRELLARMAERPLCPERLAGFGDLASLVGPAQLFDEEADRMARAAHEVFLAAQHGADSPAAVPWAELAERFRRSNRAFTDHIPTKLRMADLRLAPGPGAGAVFTEAEIATLAEAEHHRWSRDLLAAGWRAGALRDEAGRTHPLLLAWAALPETARAGNRAMVAEIPRIAALTGQIVRRVRRTDRLAPTHDADAIALIEIDITDLDGWRAADAIAEAGSLIIHARGLARASLGDLERIAREYPRAAAVVEAWADAAAPRCAGSAT